MRISAQPSSATRPHLRITALSAVLSALVALLGVAVIAAATPVLTFVEFQKDGVGVTPSAPKPALTS